jgi:protease-4
MGDYAASGGYYVAMGGDAIVAEPGTITGSIGVFSGKFNVRGLYDKIGLSKEIITRGRHAALYSSYRPWSDEERDRVQQQMLAFYKDFVKRAAEGRKKTWDEVDAVAQGRVWTGAEAKRIGLVDDLGGLDKAIDVLKAKAGIARDREVSLVTLPERKGFFESVFDRQQDDGQEALLPAEIRAMIGFARILDGAPLARLPFDLRIR